VDEDRSGELPGEWNKAEAKKDVEESGEKEGGFFGSRFENGVGDRVEARSGIVFSRENNVFDV
jgi:hypothetical protein